MAIPILGDLINSVKDIVSEVVVDKDKRDQVNLELAKLEDQAQARLDDLQQGQIEVNKVEAANNSIFVAGWRPAVGWVGAAGLAYSAILQPFASWTSSVIFHYKGGYPVINDQLLLYILGGMLGLGTMRTVEKIKGVSSNTVGPAPSPSTDVQVETDGSVSVQQKGAATTATPVAVPKKKKKFHIF